LCEIDTEKTSINVKLNSSDFILEEKEDKIILKNLREKTLFEINNS
jgi:hypothetical protein